VKTKNSAYLCSPKKRKGSIRRQSTSEKKSERKQDKKKIKKSKKDLCNKKKDSNFAASKKHSLKSL